MACMRDQQLGSSLAARVHWPCSLISFLFSWDSGGRQSSIEKYEMIIWYRLKELNNIWKHAHWQETP